MQKIRSGLIKIAGSLGILAQEELFRLIQEEKDILDARLNLNKEREDAAQVLESYASSEEEGLNNVLMEIVRDMRGMNEAATDLLNGLNDQFIDVLSTIRDKLAELDQPVKDKETAEKDVDKARKNVDKSSKKLEASRTKGDAMKVSDAEDAVTKAQSALAEAETNLVTAETQLKKISGEIRDFKRKRLKEAFGNYTELNKKYHERCLELLNTVGNVVEKIKTEEKLVPEQQTPAV